MKTIHKLIDEHETVMATLAVITICLVVWLSVVGIMNWIYYEPVVEIDTTGWSQERIEILEKWME